jgi:hypothetical protein
MLSLIVRLTVFQRRQIEGCLCRVPPNFYVRVWHVLKKTPGGIQIGTCLLPQEPTLSNLTLSELRFALQVEKILHKIAHPEYTQIVIELLCVVSTILQRNPELSFRGCLDADTMVSHAFRMFSKVCAQLELFFVVYSFVCMWGMHVPYAYRLVSFYVFQYPSRAEIAVKYKLNAKCPCCF